MARLCANCKYYATEPNELPCKNCNYASDRRPTHWAPKVPPEALDSPSYYSSHPSGVECITVAEHFGFNLGNAIKYIWRHGKKPGASALDDLRKARRYLDREIARIEREEEEE